MIRLLRKLGQLGEQSILVKLDPDGRVSLYLNLHRTLYLACLPRAFLLLVSPQWKREERART